MAQFGGLPRGIQAFEAGRRAVAADEAQQMQSFGQALGMQGQLMQVQDMARKRQEEEQLKELFRSSGGDLTKMRDSAFGAGMYKQGLELDKSIREQKKQDLEITERLGKIDKQRRDQIAAQTDLIGGAYAHPYSVLETLTRKGVPEQVALGEAQRAWERTRADALRNPLLNGTELPEQFDRDQALGMLQATKRVKDILDPLLKAEAARQSAANQPFTVGPDGSVVPNKPVQEYQLKRAKAGASVQVNNNGPLMPGKAAQTKIDEGLLDTTGRLMRLNQIEKSYRPEFQQVVPRLSATWSSIKEKAGVGLGANDQKALQEFSSYKRTAIDSLNHYINEITGAAMSEAEAQRILRGMPNPGQGVFDGDSPTEFKSKLDDAVRQTRMAEARLVYLKRNGMSLTDAAGNSVVPLERMPTLMNERGRELEQTVKKTYPSANAQDLKRMVSRQLAQEFGLAAD